jgi:hypothetical protein
MATGITKNTTIIGLAVESTEGTFLAPQGATSYVAPLEDGFELTPSKELIERNILTSSISNPTPRTGMESVTVQIPVEMRASGVEGGDPDFDPLLKGALGSRRQIAAQNTTKNSGNTGSVLQIEDADIADYNVGDMIVVLESGGHHPCFITAVDSTGGAANITIAPSKSSGSFSNSVVVSKSTTYYPANSGHQAISASVYWGNTIREYAAGCKVTQLSVENFQTGQLASFNFALEGLDFNQADGAAPHTPSYDSGTPPIILRACVYQNGTSIDVNSFSMQLTNELGFITSTCSASGKTSSRVTARNISGSVNPYKDDTSVAQWTKFDQNTEYSLMVFAYNPSSTSGEISMGSCVGIYLPQCITTELKVGDQEGILVDDISFQATAGSAGSSNDIYIGFV